MVRETRTKALDMPGDLLPAMVPETRTTALDMPGVLLPAMVRVSRTTWRLLKKFADGYFILAPVQNCFPDSLSIIPAFMMKLFRSAMLYDCIGYA
jgi:hypothetical protein